MSYFHRTSEAYVSGHPDRQDRLAASRRSDSRLKCRGDAARPSIAVSQISRISLHLLVPSHACPIPLAVAARHHTTEGVVRVGDAGAPTIERLHEVVVLVVDAARE